MYRELTIQKIILTKEKKKQGSGSMINEQICELREKLNKSILESNDYNETYRISVELDELIAKYYSMQYVEAKRKKVKKKIKKYKAEP